MDVWNVNGGQVNHASDNATIYVTQNNGVVSDELEKIMKGIMANLNTLDSENAGKVIDVVEMVREELARPEPRASRLKSCLSLLAPIFTVANGTPALVDNLQKLANHIYSIVH